MDTIGAVGMKNIQEPILYDTTKPYHEGGMGFKNEFEKQLEHDGVNNCDESITLPGSKVKAIHPQIAKKISKKFRYHS